MIDLAAFQADANALDVDRSIFNSGTGNADPEVGCFSALLWVPFAWVRAQIQQSRLNNILRSFPYSLYCPNCGHVTKRRFKPPDPE
jgi:hypothetical protein